MDLVAVSDEKFKLYEKKLLERDRYRALAEQYEREFTRVFGRLINEAYEKKIACIEKKRVVAFCRRFANRGERIDARALKEYVESEMEAYRVKLKEMIEDYKFAKSSHPTSVGYGLKVSSLYKKIAKKIHPDVYPETARNMDLLSIWNRVAVAYRLNNLEELEACEILLNVVLKKLGENVATIRVPDVDRRIKELEKEIDSIISTDPYQYKFLLEDPALVKEKKEELQREIEEYEAYHKQLDKIVSSFSIYGAPTSWEN